MERSLKLRNQVENNNIMTAYIKCNIFFQEAIVPVYRTINFHLIIAKNMKYKYEKSLHNVSRCRSHDSGSYGSGSSLLTWREFSMVNSHANTVVFSLIARTPMIHVIPSRGNKIMVLFREDLKKRELILYECELSLHEVEFKGAPVLPT